MMVDGTDLPFGPPLVPSWPPLDPSQLQVVDYETTQQQLDPTAAPEKQAKIALDTAIAGGSIDQLQIVLNQIKQYIPQLTIVLMMHALRSAANQGNVGVMQFLLEQMGNCTPQQLHDLLKYALDGAAVQGNPAMMDFLMGSVQKIFHTTYPQQFLELVQHAVNAAAKQGNLGLLKCLMDHANTAALPINYEDVFKQAASTGQAERLLKDAIIGGAHYENVILMILQSAKNIPNNNDSCLGSRLSLKNAAKLQLTKSYKQKDPALFAKLMAIVKSFFPEELVTVQSGTDGDVSM